MTVLAAGSGIGAGPIGLLVVLALLVAGVFLFRSMNKQLRKVPPSFDQSTDDAGTPDSGPPVQARPGQGDQAP